jgi:hypothetical protein
MKRIDRKDISISYIHTLYIIIYRVCMYDSTINRAVGIALDLYVGLSIPTGLYDWPGYGWGGR